MPSERTKYAVDTKVPVTQTRAEIETTLTRFGATSFAFAINDDRAMILFEFNERRIKFTIPLPRAHSETATAKLHRERWRALFLSIKAKLVSVDTGIESFEQAFLAHVVLADGSTVSEQALPAIAKQYETGKMLPLLEGPRS